MLREHPFELEADFQSVYGLDLSTIFDGGLSVRRASRLAGVLPPGSMVWRAMDTAFAWTDETYMLAVVADRVGLLVNAKLKKGAKGLDPVERPGVEKQKSINAQVMARRFLARQRSKEAENGG